MEIPTLVRWTRALEETEALDGPVEAVAPYVEKAFATGVRGEVLRGDWLGHALHPMLTDVVLGSWTSATVLDVIGGPESRAGAQRLVGVGLLVVGPTAWSGWAEWSGAARREQRVGLVHAAANGAAALAYASSWIAAGGETTPPAYAARSSGLPSRPSAAISAATSRPPARSAPTTPRSRAER